MAEKNNDLIKAIVDDFQVTELYSTDFLRDLESGLRKSSLVKQ